MRKNKDGGHREGGQAAGEYKPLPTDEQPYEDAKEESKSCGAQLLESLWFQNTMGLIILANGIVIGLETDIPWGSNWNTIENGFLGIFIFELLLKFCVDGFSFCSPEHPDFSWNMFDSVIVGLGVFDLVSAFIGTGGSGGFSTVFRLVRLLRILRIFRLLKFLKKLFLLCMGLVEACKAIFWVTIIMSFVLYMTAIVLVKTLGRVPFSDPNAEFLHNNFGNIIGSMLTLFKLMSSPNLDIWQSETGLFQAKPFLCVFLIIFITFGSFGMIAMLTGVIIDGMNANNELKAEEDKFLAEEHRNILGTRVGELYESIPGVGVDGEAPIEAVKKLIPQLVGLLEQAGTKMEASEVSRMVDFMDVNGSGTIDSEEFVFGLEKAASPLGPATMMEIHHAVGKCGRKVALIDTKLDAKLLPVVEAAQKTEKVLATMGATVAKDSGDMKAALEAIANQAESSASRNRLAIAQQVGDVAISMQQSQVSISEEMKTLGNAIQRVQDSVDSTEAKVRSAASQGLAEVDRTGMTQASAGVASTSALNSALAQHMQDMQAFMQRQITSAISQLSGDLENQQVMMQRQITGAISQLSGDFEKSIHTFSDQMDRRDARAQSAVAQQISDLQNCVQNLLERKDDRGSPLNSSFLQQLQEIQVSTQRLAEQKDVREFQPSSSSEPLGEVKAAGAIQTKMSDISQQVLEMGKSVQSLADHLDRSDARVQITVSQQVTEIKSAVQRILDQRQDSSPSESLSSGVTQQIGEMKLCLQRLLDQSDSGQEKRLRIAIEDMQISAQKLVDLKQGEREVRDQLALSQQIEAMGASLQALVRQRDTSSKDGALYPTSQQLGDIQKLVQNCQYIEEIKNSVKGLVERGDDNEVNLQGLHKRLDAIQKSLLGGIAELGGVVLGGVADIFAKNRAAQRSPSIPRAQDFAPTSPPQLLTRVSTGSNLK